MSGPGSLSAVRCSTESGGHHLGNGRVLHAEAAEVGDADLLRRGPTRAAAGEYVAERDRSSVDAGCVLQFSGVRRRSRASQATTSARLSSAGSSSCLPGVSEPTAVTWVPGSTDSISGPRLLVAVTTMSLSATAAPRSSASPVSSSAARAAAAVRLRPHTVTARCGRASRWAWICARACSPVPTTSSRWASGRASVAEARAPAAAVRISVSRPPSASNQRGVPVVASRTTVNPVGDAPGKPPVATLKHMVEEPWR